jgi:hypothetical protein
MGHAEGRFTCLMVVRTPLQYRLQYRTVAASAVPQHVYITRPASMVLTADAGSPGSRPFPSPNRRHSIIIRRDAGPPVRLSDSHRKAAVLATCSELAPVPGSLHIQNAVFTLLSALSELVGRRNMPQARQSRVAGAGGFAKCFLVHRSF